MKTKDLNFIEAYEAFKAGHNVYIQQEDGNPFKADKFFEKGTMILMERIVDMRFYVKQKPNKNEFSITVLKDRGLMLNGDLLGKVSSEHLIPFIGRKCKVNIEEIIE